MTSSAYVTCTNGGKTSTWHFTGVVSVEHNLALNLSNTESEGADIINGARNLPNQVTLNVLELDTEHSAGWSAAMLSVMSSLKRSRLLCTVVTSMATYERMLLTEVVATQDEETQEGWSGSLTFMEYVPVSAEHAEEVKANSNSSVRTNTGTAGTKKISKGVLADLLRQ